MENYVVKKEGYPLHLFTQSAACTETREGMEVVFRRRSPGKGPSTRQIIHVDASV